MFSIEDRARVSERLVRRARDDARVVAAAFVGASAVGGDRWSDVDLAFAVDDIVPIQVVLDDWTRTVLASFGAVALFDLTVGPIIYRVFLFPGMLQVDLSFAPAAAFMPRGPRFRLLFGEAGAPTPFPAGQEPDEFGLAVHHVIRTDLFLLRATVASRMLDPSSAGRGLDAGVPSAWI